MDKAIKEIEDLFGTKAKDNVIYFNDINYTPIPRPVVNAVKAIMEDYPDLGCQIGLYSVKVFDRHVRHSDFAANLSTELIENAADREIDSSKTGEVHDEYVTGNTSKEDAIKQLKDAGYRNAKQIVDKWGTPVQSGRSFIKSSLSEFFPVTREEGEELDELEKTFKDKSELRNVLEDFFHIYDDYAIMSVEDFDNALASYFDSLKE